MKCPKCGFEAAEGCIICPECLTRLAAEENAVSSPAPESKSEPAPEPERKNKGEAPAARKHPVLRTLLFILGALLVLGGAAIFVLSLSGCADKEEIDNELFAIVDENGEEITGTEEQDGNLNENVTIFDPVAFPYAGSPITGTWVLLEDYQDGYDDWDYISELTSDGYVYEWYGDGLGYYEPLCTYEYTGDSIIYHYTDHDSAYSCRIDGDGMVTADSYGTECEYYRLSPEINLSVADVKALYGE